MKIAVFSKKSYDKEFIEKIAKEYPHEITYFEASLEERTVGLAKGYDAICVFVNDVLTAKVVEELAGFGIKLIVLRCAGFNNVDVEAAGKCGLRILRVPAYSPHAVAEHAVALLLTLDRKTHKAYNRIREGNFSIERLSGFELNGKTVGVIGAGRIGCIFAKIMLAFGCKVVLYDFYKNKELEETGAKYCSLEEVFSESDIISLHCPLTPETFHMINEKSISIMKRGVMIINTSRGKLIDTDATIQALKDGHIGYMGLDVYEQEEKLFFKDLSEIVIRDDRISRLMTFPNVLITAHQAYFTDNAMEQISRTTLQNVSDYENGAVRPENEVTQAMIRH